MNNESNYSNKTSLNKLDFQKDKQILFQVAKELNFPASGDVLNLSGWIKEPEVTLQGFYFFKMKEVIVKGNISYLKEIAKFINEKTHTLLSACYSAGIEIAFMITSFEGTVDIYIGFKSNENRTNEYYKSLLTGPFPSNKYQLLRPEIINKMQGKFKYGGLIKGIPFIDKDERHKANINFATVLRSMYGKNFVLLIKSNPIIRDEILVRLKDISKIRDELHTRSKFSYATQEGSSKTVSETESTTTSVTKGKTSNPATLNLGVLTKPLGRSKTQSKTESETKGITIGESTQESETFTVEKINSFIGELERYAEREIERLVQGLSSGLWETVITFSTEDKTSAELFSGALIGEIVKPVRKLHLPPQFFLKEVSEKEFLLIPKSNKPFENKIASYLTTEELSLFNSPPFEQVPGFEIEKIPDLSLTDVLPNEDSFQIGKIADHGMPITNSTFSLSLSDINKHTFICGITGSGKTTTVKTILKNLQKWNIPFLVIESTNREYRQLLGDEIFKDKLMIFTIGDPNVSPISFNPFYVQRGIHPLVHIDFLKAIFNASFSLYGPMPYILEKCLYNIYLKKGWDLTRGYHPFFASKDIKEDKYKNPAHYYMFPTISDLKDEVKNFIESESGYAGELNSNIKAAIITRLESLCVGSKNLLFNTYEFYPIEQLLSQPVIFELESLSDDDDKAFFVGLMIAIISEFCQKLSPARNPGQGYGGLRHLLVIEEAHRLLKNISTERYNEMMGNPKGKAIELFCNVLAELRSSGQGVIVAEQIPTKIALDVIKNSNTKIVHRIVSYDDQKLMSGSLSLNEQDLTYLNNLKTGQAICFKEGMSKPIECFVNTDCKDYAISDERISIHMKNFPLDFKLHSEDAYIIFSRESENLISVAYNILNSLCLMTYDDENLKKIIEFAKSSIKKLSKYDDEFSNDLFANILSLGFFNLFTKGLFNHGYNFSEAFRKNLIELLQNPDMVKFKKFKEDLKIAWKDKDPENIVIEVVCNLTKYLLKKNNIDKTYWNVHKIVSEFFILIDSEKKENIINQILYD